MIKLETKRLIIIPLDLENFRLFIEDKKSIEKNLGVNITGNELSKEMQEIFKGIEFFILIKVKDNVYSFTFKYYYRIFNFA